MLSSNHQLSEIWKKKSSIFGELMPGNKYGSTDNCMGWEMHRCLQNKNKLSHIYMPVHKILKNETKKANQSQLTQYVYHRYIYTWNNQYSD